jgi:uncharacterized protein (DUF2062 family)
LTALLEIAAEDPAAIGVGVRAIATESYPRRSRVGRRASNAMVRLLSGLRVADSQCGLRVYPVAVIDFLQCRSGRYAFETEVLIRAGWANVPVRETPVQCIYYTGDRRVSHFNPWRDSISAAWMHTRLLLRAVWPMPLRKYRPAEHRTRTGTAIERCARWLNPLPMLRALRCDDPTERERFARSVGAGAFVAMTPPLGFKTFLCLAAAKRFGLQPTVMLAVSSLQTPPVGLPLALISVHTGHLLLTGRLADAGVLNAEGGWPSMIGSSPAAGRSAAVVSGAAVGALAYTLTRARVACPARPADATTAAAMSGAPSHTDTP